MLVVMRNERTNYTRRTRG